MEKFLNSLGFQLGLPCLTLLKRIFREREDTSENEFSQRKPDL